MNFTGKVFLITGASSGIGADAAIHLSKIGASVAIVGRDAIKLNIVAQKIHEAGSSEPLQIVADVTKDAARIINETVQKFRKIDVLVNSAGIALISGETLDNLDVYDRVMDTNVRSILEITKLAVPHLEATQGNVINVSSVGGSIVESHGVVYAMSKAALDHFTRCAAVELAPKGIRVNSINPGAIVTPIFETAGMSADAIARYVEQCETTHHSPRRPGSVEDTSSAIAFLASNAANFITGHLLFVDGGRRLMQ